MAGVNKYTAIIAQLDEVILARATGGAVVTSINGVSMEYASLDSLKELRAFYKGLEAAEDVRLGNKRSPYSIGHLMYL